MLVYLSHSLSEQTPVYGGETGIIIQRVKQISKGDSSNTQKWTLSNHIGTHVDAPRHFFESAPTIVSYSADYWICGKISVVYCPMDIPRFVEPFDLERAVGPDTDCILIKTGFQKYRDSEVYFKDGPGLSPEFGVWLRDRFPSVKFIGMDFISVSRFPYREQGRKAHAEFLRPVPPGRPILPIEDMDLSQVWKDVKIQNVWIFPLRVDGADGAPVTVVAEL